MANATIIYACTPDGLAIFNKPGTLNEWLPPRHTLAGSPVMSAWAEPGPPIRVLAVVNADPQGGAGAGGALLLSESGGRDWETVLGGPVTALLYLPGDPARLLVGMEEGGLSGSVDGGRTWGILPGLEQKGRVRLLLADRDEPDRLYILTALDEGGTALLDGKLEEGSWRRQAIDGATALCQDAGSGDLYAAGSKGVRMSVDKGDTWSMLPGSPANGIAIEAVPGPQDASPSILVGTDTGLFISPDGGGAWQAGELPDPGGVVCLARDPERRDRIYAATREGYLYESGNRGQSWQRINADPIASANYLYVVRI